MQEGRRHAFIALSMMPFYVIGHYTFDIDGMSPCEFLEPSVCASGGRARIPSWRISTFGL
jgi:hypothetical protein